MGFALALAVGMTALGGEAIAHDSAHGQLTFYDAEDGSSRSSASLTQAPVDLSCEFWLEGSRMSHAEGTIEVTPSIPRSGLSATLGTWTASDDGNGTFSFEAGPFELPETGIYRVWAQVDGDHRTVAHEVAYEGCEEEGSGGEKVDPPVSID